MSSKAEWTLLMAKARRRAPNRLTANTILARTKSKNSPVIVRCDDRQTYYVKGRQNGRCILTDFIVGRIGRAMRAPVAHVRVVDMPDELILSNLSLVDLGDFQPGPSFGSLQIPGCRDSYGYEHLSEQGNIARFAFLAALFGWTVADDRHYLYKREKPYLVFSVDHCEFFPDGPAWSEMRLRNKREVSLDAEIVLECNLSRNSLEEGRAALNSVNDMTIASCIGVAPVDWSVEEDDRVALAQFLSDRRKALLSRPLEDLLVG